jgi:hypothetical protein
VLPGYVVYIAATISALGVVGYILDTFRGNTFPHRVTWFLWGLIPLVTTLVQVRAHVGIQMLMTVSYVVAPAGVVVASFVARRGSWTITRFDWVCGGVCLVAVAVYSATLKGNLAIVLLVTADGFAALPTMLKSWKAPETETWTAFLGGFTSSTLTLLTVTHWTLPTYGLSTWIGLQSGTEILLIRGCLGPRLARARAFRT